MNKLIALAGTNGAVVVGHSWASRLRKSGLLDAGFTKFIDLPEVLFLDSLRCWKRKRLASIMNTSLFFLVATI